MTRRLRRRLASEDGIITVIVALLLISVYLPMFSVLGQVK